MSFCLSQTKRFGAICCGVGSVSGCPDVYFVVATTEDDSLLLTIKFEKKAVLPSLNFESHFVDTFVARAAFHLVAIARPLTMIKPFAGIFQSGMEEHLYFF